MITIEKLDKYLEAYGKPAGNGYLLKDAGQGNYIARWDIADLAQPTDAMLSKYDAAVAADKAMADWKKQMDETDIYLPRWGEDIIDALDPAVRASLSAETLEKYNDKKTKRGQKPA